MTKWANNRVKKYKNKRVKKWENEKVKKWKNENGEEVKKIGKRLKIKRENGRYSKKKK